MSTSPKLSRREMLRALLMAVTAVIWWSPVALADRVTYLHVDALGSPSLATDENGAVLWREHYEPFGSRIERATASADNPLWFTGQEQDAQTGLVHMGARYYHPGFGRFLSVDPAPADFGNPHLFNRYTYANNNPYKYVDPEGELPILLVAYGAYKVGMFAWDAYQTYETVNDPNASDAEKALAVTSFAVGTIDPSGVSRGVRIADRVNDVVQNAKIAERSVLGFSDDVAKEIGILRDAAKGKGDFGLGSATRSESDKLGKAWVGDGYSVASDGRTLVSKDKMRQYRPPSEKPSSDKATTGTQANFERRLEPDAETGVGKGEWQGNGHLDITD